MRLQSFTRAVLVACLLTVASGNSHSADLAVVPVGDGSFSVEASGLTDMAALDLELSYDQQALGAPTVQRGIGVPGDVSFSANVAIPGEIRILLVRSRPLPGAGSLAIIRFPTAIGTDSGFRSATASLVSTKGTPYPLGVRLVHLQKPTESARDTSADEAPREEITSKTVTAAAEASANSASQSAEPLVAGATGVNTAAPLAAKQDLRPEATAAATTAAAATATASLTSSDLPAKSVEPPPLYPSVLSRFRELNVPRTKLVLTGLFKPLPGQPFSQRPAIAVADGASSIALKLKLPVESGASPSFGVTGGQLVSVKKSGKRSWTVTVVPDAGAMEAAVTAETETTRVEFPLVVTPAVESGQNQAPTLDDKGFELVLGAEQLPFDLNGDGSHDFRDDYIFTANYLLQKERSGTKAKGSAKKPVKKPSKGVSP